MAYWNINGWSGFRDSREIRANIISYYNADVYGLCETHLRKTDKIQIKGYSWFGHNRLNVPASALRGSGGVGFLIKDTVLDKYNLKLLDSHFEGILWIELRDKKNLLPRILLCVAYLPPENSSRGNSAQEFYDTLLTQVYSLYTCSDDVILIGGDFNSRIGNKQDYCASLDHIKDRNSVDTGNNKFGSYFLDFLKDCAFCVVSVCY